MVAPALLVAKHPYAESNESNKAAPLEIKIWVVNILVFSKDVFGLSEPYAVKKWGHCTLLGCLGLFVTGGG
jgi:hypothetical protein